MPGNQNIASHATLFCNHLAKLLQYSIQENPTQPNTSHATIFCNHLAKLLQKIISSLKTQQIASHATIFWIILQSLCSPTEDFWMAERTFGIEFSNYFSNERSKIEYSPAVGNSPPFLNESPFRTFIRKFQPEFMVVSFDESTEMEIRSKKGASCRRLVLTPLKRTSKTRSQTFVGLPNLRLGSINLLQKIVASQKTQHIACYYLL